MHVGNTTFQTRNYMVKSRLIEDIILQSIEQNINWGIMEEDEAIRIGKRVLLGFDIPGLNAPLRVHCNLTDLKSIMHDYLKTDEVPLYVGTEDFRTSGRGDGTPLLLPLRNPEINYIKKVSKKKNFESGPAEKYIKHVACTQMPNQLKRILSEKTGKTQKYPDKANIYTKKIIKSDRTASFERN